MLRLGSLLLFSLKKATPNPVTELIYTFEPVPLNLHYAFQNNQWDKNVYNEFLCKQ